MKYMQLVGLETIGFCRLQTLVIKNHQETSVEISWYFDHKYLSYWAQNNATCVSFK